MRTKATSGGAAKGYGGTAMQGSYRDILASIAESLKPGGEIERAQMADIEQEGKLLSSQLSASAVGRGLGNVNLGIPSTVMKHVSGAKQKARSSMLEQYLGVLTNLANMAFQEEQAAASRQAVAPQQTGLDAFGKPMRGTLAEAEMRSLSASPVAAPTTPNARALPSLYVSGGAGQAYGAGIDYMSPYGSPVGDTSRISFATPMMGSLEEWQKATMGGKQDVPWY